MATRRGTEIEVRCGDSVVSAYVAIPHSGTGPGILVVHDEWGLNDFARDMCDRLARADFVALGPDLLNGRRASDAASAGQQASEIDIEQGLAILDASVIELFNQHATDGKSVGALGFGMGGQLALGLAGRNSRVGAVADFYGQHSGVEPDFAAFEAPVLAVFCADSAESAADRLEATLDAAGVRHSIQTRSDARAGFMDDSRLDVHNAVAEFESWDALLAFFRAELP